MITVERRGDWIALMIDDGRTLLLAIDEVRELLADLDAALPQTTVDEAAAMVERQLAITKSVSGATCSLGCHEPIVDRETYSEVTGYVRTQRKGGGVHQVALRKPTGRIAHAHCVDDAKKGGVGQERML